MKRILLITGAIALMGVTNIVKADPDMQAGKAKSERCAGCHGDNGEGDDSNPRLAGMARDQFVKAIAEYKSGERKHTAMRNRVSKLTAQDTEDLAAYYASLRKN